MRMIAACLALSALAACQKAPAPPVAEAPPQPQVASTPAVQAAPTAAVEGWQTDAAGYARLGSTLPDFSFDKVGGGKVKRDDLRDRWTILGFWYAATAGIEDESRFIRALNSAADQDPDLDFQSVHLKLGADTDVSKWFANNGGAWPALIDKGTAAALFGIDKPPTYLLIGPDLTIEAWRGALAATPDDGIKSVIRGVAEIRKQVAAPG